MKDLQTELPNWTGAPPRVMEIYGEMMDHYYVPLHERTSTLAYNYQQATRPVDIAQRTLHVIQLVTEHIDVEQQIRMHLVLRGRTKVAYALSDGAISRDAIPHLARQVAEDMVRVYNENI